MRLEESRDCMKDIRGCCSEEAIDVSLTRVELDLVAGPWDGCMGDELVNALVGDVVIVDGVVMDRDACELFHALVECIEGRTVRLGGAPEVIEG